MPVRLFALTVVLLLCSACGPAVPKDTLSPAPEPALSDLLPDPSLPDVPVIAFPSLSSPSSSSVLSAPPDQAPSKSLYDFSSPVPETVPVDNDYFADAAFVGDSRMEGFWLYSGVRQGKRLTSEGLSVFTIDSKKVLTVNGTHITVLDALAQKKYKKVYLCLGVNELGYRDSQMFYEVYCQVIDAILACQPEAVIYVQTLIPVNEEKVAASGGGSHLNNDRIRLYNELICKAAAQKKVPVLDLYSCFAVNGQLPAEGSRDGVHLTRNYCKKQLDYLKAHTVSFDAVHNSTKETDS